MIKNWDDFYRKTPLDKIPWNITQADYFNKKLKGNQLGSGKALDLGCGVGRKSIELAKNGFKVIGIDISKTAIKHAKHNAKQEDVEIKFIVGDAVKLSKLISGDFDLILDWANLHGIPEDDREVYIAEIIKHLKSGGIYLLRCFSKHGQSPNEIGFITKFGNVYYFSNDDIEKLYGKAFNIIEINRSKPATHSKRWLDEYLMIKK